MHSLLKKKFYFVRHAETDWNQKKLCQGQTDIPLSQKGYQDAKNFALKCQGFPIDCIVSSPLNRALETAKEISKTHPNATFHTIAELAERSWGSYEGVSSQDMYTIELEEEKDPSYIPGQGVEERTTFRERILRGISAAQKHHPHPLIVSHGRVFLELCFLLEIPPIRQIPNCQLINVFPGQEGWSIQIIEEFNS